MSKLILERFKRGSTIEGDPEFGTFGKLLLPTGKTLFTVERPWINNEPRISCIPEGTYKMRKRRSGVVQRSTKGEFKSGWEICDVPGRTFIMVHPANWPEELEGCIGVGLVFGELSGRLAVKQSLRAFRQFMLATIGEEHELEIKWCDQ